MQVLKQERVAGIALIVAVLMGLAVMGFHPTGHDLTPHDHGQHEAAADMDGERQGLQEDSPRHAQLEHAALLNRLVHGFGLVALGVIFLGLLSLRRSLGGGDWAVLALAAQAIAALAGMMAALASGFVSTPLFEALAWSTEADEARQLLAEIRYTHRWNQAFAKLYGIAFSIGLLAWTAELRRCAGSARLAGGFGAALGLTTLAALLSDHLTLGVHGFGLLFASQGIWIAWIGALMIRGDKSASE